jgi:hypothetical protein
VARGQVGSRGRADRVIRPTTTHSDWSALPADRAAAGAPASSAVRPPVHTTTALTDTDGPFAQVAFNLIVLFPRA